MENKNYLNQSFVILSDCLKNFKHIYEEKKMKLLEKLFEEEATRTKVLQNNPNITSFITNFSKLKRETNNKIENAFKLSFETEGEKSEEKKEVFDNNAGFTVNENDSHEKEENKQRENNKNLEDNNDGMNIQSEQDSENYDSIAKNPIQRNEKKFNSIFFFQRYVKKFKTLEYLLLYILYHY